MRWPEPIRHQSLGLAHRLGGWPRRLAALLCLAAAGWSAVQARQDPVVGTAQVVVAARDLAAGTVIANTDVRVTQWPTAQVPPAAVRSTAGAVGASVAAAMDAGEPVTRARLRGAGVTTGLPAGWVAITIVLDNAGTAGLIQPGDEVDVLAAARADAIGSTSTRARLVASGVRVLGVLLPDDRASPSQLQLPSVVLGADRGVALDLASVSTTPVTVTIRRP